MAIIHSTGVLLGTSETVGDTIANGASDPGAQVDVLGDDTSVGEAEFYLCATSTVTTGTIDIYINKQRVTGAGYSKLNPDYQITPINGTVKYPLGRRAVSRYMSCNVVNNGTGASLTNVTVGYELFKAS